MEARTLGDVRAEMARERVTVAALAKALGVGYARLSTLLNGDDFVMLHEAGAERIARALEQAKEAVA